MVRNSTRFLKAVLVILIYTTQHIHCQTQYIIDSLKIELGKTIADTHRVIILNEIGGYLLKIGNYDQAKPYLSTSKDLAQELKYQDGLAVAFNRTAVMYMDVNDYETSMIYYEKALDIRKEMGDLRGGADVISNMGIVYANQGLYEKALRCYLIALRIRETIHDPFGMGNSLIQIGNIHFTQKNYSFAAKNYLQALTIKEINNDLYNRAIILNNIGLTHIYRDNSKEALKYFNQALAIDVRIGDKEGIANCYNYIGEALLQDGDFKQALTYLKKGLASFEDIQFKKGICESYTSLGNIYIELKEYDEALKCFYKQLTIAKEIDSKANISIAQMSLSALYEKMHNYKKAYEYYKLYKQTEEDIYSTRLTENLQELEIKYNLQKREIEISALKNEKLKQDAKYHKKQQMTYTLIISGILISLVLFLLFNRQQIKKKHILQKQNYEFQLKTLSEQMNPHFIFNSLNSIMEFIRTSKKENALIYLTKFSKLIRLILESNSKKTIPLETEIELLKLYIDLEKLRFNNSFDYKIKIDEALDIYNLELPPLIIQPFVENAILHGIQNKINDPLQHDYKGDLLIHLELKNSLLSCKVVDNGVGVERARAIKAARLISHQSLGMRITGDRLNLLSQNKCTFELVDIRDKNNEVCGTEARILIPLVDPFK